MSGPKPTRDQGDLAEMLETLLDKGVVINADIAVSVGDTELLGVKLRAAVASFETAAAYGLEFPGGTDMDRVRYVADVDEIPDRDEGVGEVVLDDDGDAAEVDANDADRAPGGDTEDAADNSTDTAMATQATEGGDDATADSGAEDVTAAPGEIQPEPRGAETDE